MFGLIILLRKANEGKEKRGTNLFSSFSLSLSIISFARIANKGYPPIIPIKRILNALPLILNKGIEIY